MRIELITKYYGYPGVDVPTKEEAVRDATVLAGNGGLGSGYAPAYDVRVESSADVQESKTVGATWRQLFSRGNRASSLRFKTKPRYATPGEATEAAFALAIRAGLEGQLRVIPATASDLDGQLGVIPATNTEPVETETEPETVEPETETAETEPVGPEPVFVHPYNAVHDWFKEDMKHAVLKRVRTKQIGVTVEVEYEIEF